MRNILFSALIGLSLSQSSCMRTTGTTEVGVLVKKFSLFGQRGIQQDIYAPGSTYFVMPLFTEWYTFDTKSQNLEMMAEAERGDRRYDDQVRFKTIDGNDIGLDVLVSYHIIPGEAPRILKEVASSDEELKNNVVRSVARSVVRDVFGELKTEEFYISATREKKAEEAQARLNEALGKLGISVERVSTKDYRFNNEYQQAIEDRKVADQKAEKFRSETNAKVEEFQKRIEQAKGQVNEMIAQADGEFRKAEIEAESYYSQQLRRAEAIRAEAEAEAKGIVEMNKALAAGGGDVMVKLKIAEALQGKQIIVMPQGGANSLGFQTLNLNQFLGSMGLNQIAEGK